VPVEVVRDTIQPFPSFSEIVAAAIKQLRQTIRAGATGESQPVTTATR
jgi:hypothetical protein